MSTLQNNQPLWSKISGESLDSKYEKCLNITEEIYKRINITFQIKKLETGTQSDVSELSDQIDSNELSNETDLFACDKSDSIPSSTEGAEGNTAREDKYININNNEELKKVVATPTVLYKRPRKRFRKRVKKRQSKCRSDSDGSSDEALPLSRMLDIDTKCFKGDISKSGSPDHVMGVPNIVIVTKDLKPKIQLLEKKSMKKEATDNDTKKSINNDMKKSIDKVVTDHTIDTAALDSTVKDEKLNLEWKHCSMCSLSFRGERGLRRHMTMSHNITSEDMKKTSKQDRAY